MPTPDFPVLDWNRTSQIPPLPQVDPADTGLADSSDYVFGSTTPVLAAMLPESPVRHDEVRRELQTAGYYQPHAAQNLAAIRYVCILAPLLLLGLMLIFTPRRF